jgi:hypothetical protein
MARWPPLSHLAQRITMPAVTIEHSLDEAVMTMSWHDLFAIWLKGTLTIANQRETEEHAQKCIRQWSRGIGIMVVVDDSTPPISTEVRRELDAIYRRLTPGTRGVSYVILGNGFNTAVARGALAATNWVMRRPYPTSTANDLNKGARWLHYALGEDPERGSVEQFIQALAAAVRGEAPQTLKTQKQSQ